MTKPPKCPVCGGKTKLVPDVKYVRAKFYWVECADDDYCLIGPKRKTEREAITVFAALRYQPAPEREEGR